IEEPRDGPALHGAIDEDAERPPAAVVRLDSRILRQRALQHHSRRLADHELMDALGQRFGAVLALARRYVALLGGEDGGAEPARLTAPPLVTAEYVQCIARRETRQGRQPPVHQPAQRLDALGGARDLIEPPRRRAQRLPDPQLQPIELR